MLAPTKSALIRSHLKTKDSNCCDAQISSGGFKELDRIAIRILELDLSTTRSNFHGVAEGKARLLQFRNQGGKIGDLKHDAIPSTSLLPPAIGHRTRTR